MRDPIESYFAQLRDIRASGAGVAETSYYPALSELLTALGGKLKPKVTAIINLRNTGAGIPDGGLFTASQLKGSNAETDPLPGQLPARGAIEVKGTSDDAFAVAKSEQVARYVERYGLVLVTNLRDFVLVGRSANGTGVRELESLRLAETEAGFWARVSQPRKYADDTREGVEEFLRRVLLHNAPLADPKDLAWFLASYARTARLRLEHKRELPALAALRAQLEDALGLKFEGDKGDHFFRSTLVQTLFYGMFAAWVLWARGRDRTAPIPWDQRFQWETATATLHVPMVYELFRQFADVRQLGALGIAEVLEWAEEILWRVDRAAFFERFQEDHAVQYFYEPFLEAFDPQLRKELGVWYTPDEVVKYMVARVDWALREELGIADGLADPDVVVLDPCCGTGAYLVEVLRTIDRTLEAKGADALTRHDVKRAAMDRVIGFEIMPAPFVVAHLQLGILLAELGVPLRDADERAAVYLTNALTGWNQEPVAPPKEKKGVVGQLHSSLLFPEFAEERDAANHVKRDAKILVVIGNPPYNGYAGVAVDEERELTSVYRTAQRTAAPQGRGFNDLYARFLRIAERQIAERSRRGAVCLISNYSWLDGLSFTGMREHFLEGFDHIWVDNLNGDKYKSGKLTPSGEPDPSVFSTPHNREGIQVGTAIALMVHSDGSAASEVSYRELWGTTKLAALAADAACPGDAEYSAIVPDSAVGFPFVPMVVADGYLRWPKVTDLLAWRSPGVTTSRDQDLVDIDLERLKNRMNVYFDRSRSLSDVAAVAPSLTVTTGRFDPDLTRQALLAIGPDAGTFARYAYRPFDDRWVYWHPSTKLLDEKRESLMGVACADAMMFTCRQKAERQTEGSPFYVTTALPDWHLTRPGSVCFPASLPADGRLFRESSILTPSAAKWESETLGHASDAGHALWLHVLAIGHSSRYLTENVDAIRQDWPRIPLPRDYGTVAASAALGRRVASLIVGQGDTGATPPVGVLAAATGMSLDPSTDLAITARWGIAGKGGITMPSTGKLTERPYTADELGAIEAHAATLGMTRDEAVGLLGETCFDVYLNGVAYWRCVPSAVWRYTIGGYQVIKKWLSYRECALLGRDLKPEEARYVTEMVRRIAALVLMQPELDANYERVKSDVWEWGE